MTLKTFQIKDMQSINSTNMKTITTQCGEVVIELPNILNLRHNAICKKFDGSIVVVHKQTNKLNVVFTPDVDDWTIQSCCFAVERIVEPLPITLTISNYVPPINEHL
jgi:hypothetical protein